MFLEAFGNTAELLADEYGPYEASSFFICVVDHLRMLPAGVMRVVLPSPRGFKSLNDIEPVWGEPAESAHRAHGLALDSGQDLGHRDPRRGRRVSGEGGAAAS